MLAFRGDSLDGMTVDSTFIKNMKVARNGRGWSQAEFARRLREAGLSNFYQTTLSRVENGDRELRLAETEVIADVLGVEAEQMFSTKNFATAVQLIEATTAARQASDGLLDALATYVEAQAYALMHVGHFKDVPAAKLEALQSFADGSVLAAARDMLSDVPAVVAARGGEGQLQHAEQIVERALAGVPAFSNPLDTDRRIRTDPPSRAPEPTTPFLSAELVPTRTKTARSRRRTTVSSIAKRH